MQLFVFCLVMAAALMHASWNATLRDVKGNSAVFLLARYVGSALAILAAGAHALWTRNLSGFTQVLAWDTAGFCCILSALVHCVYQMLLAYAYRDGDLSVMYPIARGSGVAFTAILSVLATNVTISLVVCEGIAAVVLGILLVGLQGFHCAAKSEGHGKKSLLNGCETSSLDSSPKLTVQNLFWTLSWQVAVGCSVGLTIATYQIIDKTGVSELSTLPIAYTGFMSMLNTAINHTLSPGTRIEDLKLAFSQHSGHIYFIGSASISCYCIITGAMQVAPVAIVGSLRESSVLFGAVLGSLCFKEPCNAMKMAGLVLILVGMVTVKVS